MAVPNYGFDIQRMVSNLGATILRPWQFLAPATFRFLKIPAGATVGSALVCTDSTGSVEWSNIIPSTVSSPTDQTASVVDTLVTGAAGEWLVAVYHEVITLGSGNTSVLTTSLQYTDDNGTQTIYPVATIPLNAVGYDSGMAFVHCASGNIEYTVNVGSVTGAPHWSAVLVATKVGE